MSKKDEIVNKASQLLVSMDCVKTGYGKFNLEVRKKVKSRIWDKYK